MVIAIVIYAAVLVGANLLVATFGPAVTPINAFLFIGLDLALRDWLHTRLKFWQMGLLIAATGVATFVLNPAAGQIAIASAVAFAASALVDWLVFSVAPGSWTKRANISNVAGAAVDSLLFPTIAFGAIMPEIVAGQFAAKILGGALFVWLLSYARERR